ncbi:hypothetical protein BDY19DRAFT_953056 [Irpex rosettiformis]|uniref:Uncharacterized protein n=1 Tax=Irpex rosettiformis TaxID=378272 RepID=A0ACB8U0N4_9APHY|nr:hypothetical protein BDY19DRAFT_953056 [Irpex rosettiformis]
MPTSETITLLFEPTLKVAGETIKGEVHLNFPGLIKDKIDEVYVKLRGSVYTRISARHFDQMEQEQNLRISLIHENLTLWKHVADISSYPPRDSHILIRPFQFTLPSTLLPSCEYGGLDTSVCNVRYFIQVVGQHRGKLRPKTRHFVPLPVLSVHSAGAELREALQLRWGGPWRSVVNEKDVRRGIWGERSHAKMTLVLPQLDIFPVFTSIPYTLTIMTLSKLVKHEDKPTDETPFPLPPRNPHEVSFWLESDVFMKTKSWTAYRNDNFIAHLGGLGPRKGLSKTKDSTVDVELQEKVWIPEGEEKDERGRWKQEVTFRSTLRFDCTPSFESETLNLRYRIKLRVDFPGLGNSLKADFSVPIVSSIFPPSERAWDGPPPELDLPPDYFKAVSWDEDSLDPVGEKE